MAVMKVGYRFENIGIIHIGHWYQNEKSITLMPFPELSISQTPLLRLSILRGNQWLYIMILPVCIAAVLP